MSGSWYCHLLASKRSCLQQHELQTAALASTTLDTRTGQIVKLSGKFKYSTVQCKGVVGMAYWLPCVMRGGLGGDPPPHSRGIVGPLVLFNCDDLVGQ